MLLHLGLLMYEKRPRPVHQSKPTVWGKKRALSALIQGQCIDGGVFWLGMVLGVVLCRQIWPLISRVFSARWPGPHLQKRVASSKSFRIMTRRVDVFIFICFYRILCNDYIMNYKLKSSNVIFGNEAQCFLINCTTTALTLQSTLEYK